MPKKPAKPKKAATPRPDPLIEAAEEARQQSSKAKQTAERLASETRELRDRINEGNSQPKKPPAKRGPKPELLQPFNGTFEEAVKLALSKKKPAGGWPK